MKDLSRLPKPLLATLAIFVGILFFILNDPPKTLCDQQLEDFKKSQKEFLYKVVANEFREGDKTSRDVQLSDMCKRTNSPGGCYELFYQVKQALQGIEGLNHECRQPVAELPAVKRLVWSTLDLMVNIAWSEKPPANYNERLNWLSVDDLFVFCRLKLWALLLYNSEPWESFREKTLNQLPGSQQLSRTDKWQLSLFSLNCQNYQ